MRFKTDENLHPQVAELLRQHGHDVCTIWEQSLQGSPDTTIADVIRKEQRAFITLDNDFGDIRHYPPSEFSGLIVCRLGLQHREHVLSVFRHVLRLLEIHPLIGYLWIVEDSDLRIRGTELPGNEESKGHE